MSYTVELVNPAYEIGIFPTVDMDTDEMLSRTYEIATVVRTS